MPRASRCAAELSPKNTAVHSQTLEKKGWQAGIDQTEVFQSGLGKEVVRLLAPSQTAPGAHGVVEGPRCGGGNAVPRRRRAEPAAERPAAHTKVRRDERLRPHAELSCSSSSTTSGWRRAACWTTTSGAIPGCATRCDDGGPCASSTREMRRPRTAPARVDRGRARRRATATLRAEAHLLAAAHPVHVAHGEGQRRLPGGVHEPGVIPPRREQGCGEHVRVDTGDGVPRDGRGRRRGRSRRGHSRGHSEGGRFTILLDASTCGERDFRAAAWIACCANLGRVLQTALKRGFRGRLNRFYVYPTGRAARSLLRIVKPFLGKYTPPKIVTVDAGERGVARLVEVFGVDALPPHLGGRSELISVPLSEDDEPGTRLNDAKKEPARRQEPTRGDPPAATHPRRTTTPEERPGRLRLVPRGPDPQLPPRRGPRGNLRGTRLFFSTRLLFSTRSSEARSFVRMARNAFAWHVIGSCLFGLEFSGVLSAGVSAACATWREARRSRRRGGG